ncbi:MAG: hypothetical protein LC127_13840 [Chitinophagales bacterium]|nr:hypothetical protein [Chitinophagales bacterium]
MNNVKELRDELINSFNDLKSGKIKAKDAKELTNISGKILMSAKIELDYNKYLDRKEVIDFLEVNKKANS